jgi:RNA polymerase sigma factor (sigma-70 family)
VALQREVEFERLVLAHRARMTRTIWRVLRDGDLAEDALQEALATLWRKLPVVSRHPNPEAFVLRVAIDAARDQLRARLRRERRTTPLDVVEDRGAAAWADPVERAALVREVLGAVRRLGRRQATAILLRAVEEAPYETVAQALGCSEATARVHVQRARGKLRAWLGHLRGPFRESGS